MMVLETQIRQRMPGFVLVTFFGGPADGESKEVSHDVHYMGSWIDIMHNPGGCVGAYWMPNHPALQKHRYVITNWKKAIWAGELK